MRSSKPVRVAVIGALASAALVAALPASAAQPEAPVRGTDAPGAVKDSYIVVLKDGGQVEATSGDLAAKYGAQRKLTYTASIRGFSATMSAQQARRLAADPKVAYVEQDGIARGFGEQTDPPSWGLDRVDQQSLPLDKRYAYPNDGAGATVYVVDSGVTSHPDFSGRLTSGRDLIDNDNDASDCNGHGTHVAGTVGGNSYGVAKKVKLVSVRVLGCDNSGAWSAIIGGFDWVAQNAGANSVLTASLGGSTNTSVDDAVQRVLAKNITVTLAAGNFNQDACGTSPARVPAAITVAASDDQDRRATFPNGNLSNYGTCVDVFAPGNYIISTSKNGGTQTMSGTSMATPHVAGAAAIALTAKPGSTPSQVSSAVVGAAVTGKITNPGSGSPNKLLNVTGLGGTQPGECTAPANTTALPIPDAGAAVESPITVSGCTGNGSATTAVKVDVDHPYSADLAIDLVAPDGSVYPLKKAGGVGENGVHATFTADTSGEARNGTWKLRLTDAYRFDTGTLTSWSLAL